MLEAKLEAAMVHAGVKQASFLGEGAWHYAWQVCKEEKILVLRIPKAIAYGKSVTFDEEALKAEYAGTELYYQSVNKAQKGAAPEFFKFYVSFEMTYTVAFTKPHLVNQDASPENILIDENGICLIDPYPSIYYPRGIAGNFMNLYETFFIALADTERYSRHRFSKCADKLKMIAQGYITEYSAGDSQIVSEVRGEQLLQLLETAHSHFCLLSEDLAEETKIRYGSKEEIEARLTIFCEDLKCLASSQIDEFLYFQAKK